MHLKGSKREREEVWMKFQVTIQGERYFSMWKPNQIPELPHKNLV